MNHETDTTSLPRPGIALAVTVGIMLLYSIGSLIAIAVNAQSISPTGDIDISPTGFMLALMIGQILFLLVPTLLFALRYPVSEQTLLRLNRPTGRDLLLTSFGIIGLAAVVGVWLTLQHDYLLPDAWRPLFENAEKEAEWVTRHLQTAGNPLLLLLALIAAAVTPAVSEELLFRGVLQRSFEERMSPARSILLASILFGAVHMQPTNFIGLAAIGAFLGYVAWATGSIWPAMLGHALHNGMQIIILHVSPELAQSGNDAMPVSDPTPIQLLMLAIFGGSVLAIAVRGLQRSRGVRGG